LQDPTNPQPIDDAGSQAEYFIQSVSYLESLLHNDAAALALAAYLIRPVPTAVFTGLTTEFQTLTTAQRDVVATLDIGSVVSIEKTIQTSSTTTSIVAETAALEGIAHEITFSQPHRTTIYTSPTQVYLDFILDSSTLSTVYALT
jgi:UDP-N-acetyl-D-mannosaminuronate dehydrogenase